MDRPSGSTNASAQVNCATPFKINATSANGALANPVAAVSSFTNSLGYTLTVSVLAGNSAVTSRACTLPRDASDRAGAGTIAMPRPRAT